MISIKNLGMQPLEICNLVLDFNGTIATDGKIIAEIKDQITAIKAQRVNVYCLTADSYGTATPQCEANGIEVKSFPLAEAGKEKAKIVDSLEGQSMVVGNGLNDIPMLDAADMAVAVIGPEGCCAKLINHADIVVTSIFDALDLLLKPTRAKGLLRK